MPAIRTNHTEMIGAKEYPTLSVPKRWTENSMNRIGTEIQTTCAVQERQQML
jgi:hypothetical protein